MHPNFITYGARVREQACHDFMSPVQEPSDDVTRSRPICTHVESMVTSLGLLHGQLLTMQSEDATVLRTRAECLLACARDVHDAMEEHAPGRKTGWLVGPRTASFLNTCKVFTVLNHFPCWSRHRLPSG